MMFHLAGFSDAARQLSLSLCVLNESIRQGYLQMETNRCETSGKQVVQKNNDIMPGFDDESTNAHWREWHDVSLDHPHISLVNVEQVKNRLLLRLTGLLHQGSSGYFSERVLRAINAGYTRLILNCENLEDTTRMNWYPLYMSYRPDSIFVFVGMPTIAREEIKKLWFIPAKETFDRQFQFMTSEADATKYLYNLEKQRCFRLFQKTFPCAISCPNCHSKLRAEKVGLYRCPLCRELFRVGSK
jgi:hypothetical protein